MPLNKVFMGDIIPKQRTASMRPKKVHPFAPQICFIILVLHKFTDQLNILYRSKDMAF